MTIAISLNQETFTYFQNNSQFVIDLNKIHKFFKVSEIFKN